MCALISLLYYLFHIQPLEIYTENVKRVSVQGLITSVLSNVDFVFFLKYGPTIVKIHRSLLIASVSLSKKKKKKRLAESCSTAALLVNNVYHSWMHISSFSLSFCQRFSEDECLQPSPTQASTRLPTGTL